MSDANKDQSRQDLERRLQELRETKDRSTPEFQQKQRDVSRDLNASIDRGDLDTSTPRNGAVFYDNGGSRQVPAGAAGQPTRYGESNRERALAYAKQPGNEHCRPIDQTKGGQWMEQQKLYEALPQKDADQAWGKLSGQYARNASGEAHAFVRTQSAEHRVFRSTEQPELQHNTKVTGITYHHSDHGYEMTHRQHLPHAQAEQPGPPPRTPAPASPAGPPARGSAPASPSVESPSKGRSR
jgi:hypothetical protein